MSKFLRSLFGSSSSSDEDVQEDSRIAPAMSLYKFVKDLQERHPEEFQSAKFIRVYFFSDKSVYETTRTIFFRGQRQSNRFIYIRPESIAFSRVRPDGKLINKVIDCAAEYQTYGIYINYNGNSSWDPSFQASHQLKRSDKVNIISIDAFERTYVKRGDPVKYFKWEINGVPDSVSRSLMEKLNYTEAEQFSTVSADTYELTFE